MAKTDVSPAPVSTGVIAEILSQTRRALLQTSKRNRLIKCPRGLKSKAKILEIIDEMPDEVFRIMFTQEREMSFLPGAKSRGAGEGEDETNLEYYDPPPADDRPAGIAARHTDTKLQTLLAPEALQKRLLGLSRDARTAEEEQGLNVLFLAMGFLRWTEADVSDVVHEAPLILLPIQLKREKATSSFRLKGRDDEIETNLSLQELLRSEFGVSLPEIVADETWSPSAYFAAVKEAISTKRKWSVDESGMLIGFFSFAKQVMFRDLDPKAWPNDGLLNHPLLRKILRDKFEGEGQLDFGEEDLDATLKPEDLIHVVDADSSQAVVIDAAKAGRKLVVQGPPGTGKSQTITNIIASAVHSGKTVLFVAEKMAALDVVHRRLKSVGLGAIVLELHSHKANKKAVIEELAATLNTSVSPRLPMATIAELVSVRDQLNEATKALHTPIGMSGLAPITALGEQVLFRQRGLPPPELDLRNSESWEPQRAQGIEDLVHRLATLVEKTGSPKSHPWRGCQADDVQPVERQRLANALAKVRDAAQEYLALATASAALIEQSGSLSWKAAQCMAASLDWLAKRPAAEAETVARIMECHDVAQLGELLYAGLAVTANETDIHLTFADSAIAIDPSLTRHAIAVHSGSLLRFLSPAYRRAGRELGALLKGAAPSDAASRIKLLDQLIEFRRNKKVLADGDIFASQALGSAWKGGRTNFRLLRDVLAWFADAPATGADLPKHVVTALSAASNALTSRVAELKGKGQSLSADLAQIFTRLCLDFAQAFERPSLDTVDLAALADRITV